MVGKGHADPVATHPWIITRIPRVGTGGVPGRFATASR